MDLNDLELINKERRSTKRLDGGPYIKGQMSLYGKPKQGYSLPKQIKTSGEHEYGISSYHRGKVSDMQLALSNEGPIKDMLLGNI